MQKLLSFIIFLQLLPINTLYSISFDNNKLENIIQQVWEKTINNIYNFGIQKNQSLNKKDLITMALNKALQSTNISFSLKKQEDTKELTNQLYRILLNVSHELFTLNTSNETIEHYFFFDFFIKKADNLLASSHTKKETISILKLILQKIKIQSLFSNMAEYIANLYFSPDQKTTKDIFFQDSQTIWSDWHNKMQTLIESTENKFIIPLIDTIINGINLFSYNKKLEPNQFAQKLHNTITMLNQKYTGNNKATEYINRSKIMTSLLFSQPDELNFCSCGAAPFEKRIALVIRMVNDIKAAYAPNHKKALVYTSLASGTLLQDYLILSELKHNGYTNIDINLIDLDIRSKQEIERDIAIAQKMGDSEKESHDQELLNNILDQAFYIAALKNKIKAQFVWSTKTIHDKPAVKNIPGIYITPWNNVNSYIQFAISHPQFKTDVLLLTDPSTGIFTVPDRTNANSVAITKKDKKTKCEQYAIPSIHFEKIYNSLSKQTIYTILPFVSRDIEVYISPLQTEQLSKAVIKELYTNPTDEFELQWISDIYVACMEIVERATHNNTRLYILDFIDEEKNISQLWSYTSEQYKQLPAISPNIQHTLIKNYEYRQVQK